MAKTRISITQLLAAVAAFVLVATPIYSKPISQEQAELAVIGWLQSDSVPMGETVGNQIAWTDAYVDQDDVAVYYIVYLDPSGYVIVAGDDLVEPIVGFVTGYEYYDCSLNNVMGALVGQDLMSRVTTARHVDDRLSGRVSSAMTVRDVAAIKQSLEARNKWSTLDAAAVPMPDRTAGISDVRVAPLVSTKWNQGSVGSTWCYNYYTPNHYVDGCVATAMTQFLRYWQWPTTGIGVKSSSIYVSGVSQTATTRGGDGSGGAYNWRQMPLVPDYTMTDTQRQAIGALCYDAGVAAHMQYSSGGSGAWMRDARSALVNTFKYSNAVIGGNEYSDIGASLKDMINTNLDAADPVLLAIYEYNNGQYGGGHAIVADGYGYNASTLYHHLNLGWGGAADAWYNLPTVDTGYYTFSICVACIYNVYMNGDGEIISGRITNDAGTPIPGAVVTATGTGGPYTAISSYSGIYALKKVRPNTAYTVSVSVPGCTFSSRSVTTGSSTNWATTTGNRWAIDFATTDTLPAAPSACASVTYPATSTTGIYTVSWTAATGASAYELMRSLDGGNSWVPLYSGTATSYSENVAAGIYRYAVRALSGGGVSSWTGGSGDCTVSSGAPASPATLSYPSTSNAASVTISWSSSTGATSYTLRRSADGGSTWTQVYSGSALSFTDSLASGTYRYAVKASNSYGSSSETVGSTSCIVQLAPAGPAWISYPATSSTGKFKVTWAKVTGASSYTLSKSVDGGSTWTTAYSGRSAYSSQVLTNNVYIFKVTAVTSQGTTTACVGSQCVVAIPPAAPASITYPSTSSSGFFTVVWPTASCGTVWTCERSNNNGATWTQVYQGTVYYYNDVITTPGSYKYRVKATYGGATSTWRTGKGNITMAAPATPASITYPASNATGNYPISWAASAGATSYTLMRSANGGATWLTVLSGSPYTNYTDYVIDGNYKYKVMAVGKFGSSSAKASTTTCRVKRS
jgi:hypothetical protein